MSNSQPCQAQRSISPMRVRLKWPGSSELRWATHAARANGAPSCGQRLSRAKNCPLTWNTTISRPSSVTTLLPPGAISEVVATMWRPIHSPEVVEGARIGIEDLQALGLGERRLEGETRVVVIPMRIVRGEQQPVDADPLDEVAQVRAILGFL